MMAITTRSSINVNPRVFLPCRWTVAERLLIWRVILELPE